MDSQKVNMLMMQWGKYFPEENLMYVQQTLSQMDETKEGMVYALPMKDPMVALLLSVFVGELGIDRMFVGDVLVGVLKLITCGGCGIWWLIDLFLIMKRTKEKNLEQLMRII